MGGLGVLILPYPLARTHSTLAFGIVLACADIGAVAGAAAMAAWGGTRPRIHTVSCWRSCRRAAAGAAGVARTRRSSRRGFFASCSCCPS